VLAIARSSATAAATVSAISNTTTVAGAAAVQAKALGDPTRLTIAVARWRGDELCVCDLGWIKMRAENLVGHHLRVLRETGLAESRRDGKIVFYSLTETGRTLVDVHLAAVEARM
jgi:DNA-binding transcriptional ArsR family regulator